MAEPGDRELVAKKTEPLLTRKAIGYGLFFLLPTTLLVALLAFALVRLISGSQHHLDAAVAEDPEAATRFVYVAGVWAGRGLLAFVFTAWAVLAAQSARRLTRHRDLASLASSLDAPAPLRDLLGLVNRMRGKIDGRPCLVTAKSVEVEVASPRTEVLGRRALQALAASLVESPEREAARVLLERGARRVRVELSAERIRVTGTDPGDALAVARAALALAGVGPALLVLPPPAVLATCPYCKDALATTDREGVVRCPSCETSQHASCWRENQGCAVHACERGPRGREAAREALPERA